MGVEVIFEGLMKTIGGKRGGSIGVGTEDDVDEEGRDALKGWLSGVCARGTKPAARILGETMYRVSTAPRE